MKDRRFLPDGLAVGAGLALLLMLGVAALVFRQDFSFWEKRYLAEPPRNFSLADWTLNADLEQYLSDQLPLVRMEGISHIIIGPDSPFFSLQEDRSAVEEALRTRCALLSADGLGLIFLEPEGPDYRLTPFVYIPGSGTFFRENSCASGSAAAAMVLAARSGAPVSLTLHEPGGILRAESDPLSGKTQLTIRTRLLSRIALAEDHSRIPVR